MTNALQDWLPANLIPDSRRAVKKGRTLSRGAQARAAEAAARLGEQRSWSRYAGAAALGFAAGVAVLGARKVGMQAITSLAGDWFDTLKAEHRLVETLFALVNKTEPHETGKRTALLAHIAYALVKHDLEESQVIYPAIREAGGEEAAKHLAAEHFDIKTYLHELAVTPKDDPQWMTTMHALQALITEHVREEEQDIYPDFHHKMSKEQNAKLTLALNREGIKLA